MANKYLYEQAIAGNRHPTFLQDLKPKKKVKKEKEIKKVNTTNKIVLNTDNIIAPDSKFTDNSEQLVEKKEKDILKKIW